MARPYFHACRASDMELQNLFLQKKLLSQENQPFYEILCYENLEPYGRHLLNCSKNVMRNTRQVNLLSSELTARLKLGSEIARDSN